MVDYFEDVPVGQAREFGEYHVGKSEIVEFAEQYDPQAFHTDEAAAAESLFGGLVASGWHTAAMTMRMIVDNMPSESASSGAIGVDDLRWKKPVRPGDTLHVRSEVVDKEPWRGQYGLVHSGTTVYNQDDEEVMSFVGKILYERRETDGDDASE
jgi:acyl dehydratase